MVWRRVTLNFSLASNIIARIAFHCITYIELNFFSQDTVSVGDIRIVDIGKQFSACSKIPKKGGFRVTCRKLNGRKGDYCTVESPVMRYCSTPSSTKEASKTLDGGGAREGGKRTYIHISIHHFFMTCHYLRVIFFLESHKLFLVKYILFSRKIKT